MSGVVVVLQLAQLKPLYGFIVPLFVIGFFLAALVAIALSERRLVRSGYLGGFFALLLVVNLFGPVTPAPVVKWHKFSEVRGTEKTEYSFRVVDGQGNELTYDEDATLESGSVALALVRAKMQNEFSPEKNAETARWLLDRANTHRSDVLAQSPSRHLAFPRHGFSNAWTATELRDYTAFTTVRLYRLDVAVDADGTAVTSYEETLLYEYHVDDGTTVDELNTPDTTSSVSVTSSTNSTSSVSSNTTQSVGLPSGGVLTC